MATLSAHLPSVADAKLPATYEQARAALAECLRIDECQAWADKAAAMASYAKQADDKTLFNLAVRIRARAIRRCGMLLKAIEPAANQHEAAARAGRGVPTSRAQVARDAGLSKDQQVTAIRVANVSEPDFEAAVEAEHPAVVTALAARGRRRAPKEKPSPSPRLPVNYKTSHVKPAKVISRTLKALDGLCAALQVLDDFSLRMPEGQAWAQQLMAHTHTLRAFARRLHDAQKDKTVDSAG